LAFGNLAFGNLAFGNLVFDKKNRDTGRVKTRAVLSLRTLSKTTVYGQKKNWGSKHFFFFWKDEESNFGSPIFFISSVEVLQWHPKKAA
jgi:hypothetical protein